MGPVFSCIISLLTLMPNDCILEATSFPILPSPTIPSTLPYSSAPMNCKIRNQTMTRVSHLISDDRLNNGADHATVIALCADCKCSESTQGANSNLCSPFCDPSSLVSSTSQLEAHFCKQNGTIMAVLGHYLNAVKKTQHVAHLTLRGSSAEHMSARRR